MVGVAIIKVFSTHAVQDLNRCLEPHEARWPTICSSSAAEGVFESQSCTDNFLARGICSRSMKVLLFHRRMVEAGRSILLFLFD